LSSANIPPIWIRYQLERAEYLKAIWAVLYRRLWWGFWAAALPLLCFPWMVIRGEPDVSVLVYLPMLIFPGLMWVGMPGVVLLSGLVWWRRVPQLREPMEWEFTDEGYSVSQPSAAAQASWSTVPRVERAWGVFLITTCQGPSFFIPVRAFRSAGALYDFKQLVQSKVRDTAHL
jgi:hypothetical protein